MVACLEKSEGNADFHEIVDFLTVSSVRYTLIVSPTIYASYIEQFWNTAHSQTFNDVDQIHATVDGKTVVISESSVRSDLYFNDEDGITCLTNETIFENLALMGYESDSNQLTFHKALFSPQWKYLIHTILHCLSLKSTSWNEFSTNIASAVICLANGQKFNFSKLIFDGMLRNLDTNTKKFLMYPRFLQLFLNNQITLAEPFNDVYQTPAHTKKVFTNMKRKGKDFSGRVTPLFASMFAPPVVEGEGSGQPSEPQPAPSTAQPRIEEQISMRMSLRSGMTKCSSTNWSFNKYLQEDSQFPSNVSTAGPSTSTAGDIFEDEIMTIADTLVAIRSTRPRTTSVVIHDVEEEPRRSTPAPTAQPSSKDKGKAIMVEPAKSPKNPIKAQIQKGCRNSSKDKGKSIMMEPTKSPKNPIKAQIQRDVVKDSRKGKAEGSRKKIVARKRTGEKLDDESVNRQKIEDDAEKEELKAYLDIIPRDDETINVESLATKGDGSTKPYKIFTEILDDFDRQDVLDLYTLVKERFETASTEGYDIYFWRDLISVFEPSKDDEIWKAQQDYTLISWRLFDSCGVHVLLMDTGVAIHMLIKKTYPFTQEMLSRMLSRRLEVDHECKMAYELLGFTRSQLQK
ncbi:hypothetical protein Tco_1212587 [Tanacetum coccineum]